MYILALLLLLCPSLAFAAYQDPVVISKEPRADGIVKLVVEFSGNAGEPSVRRDYNISASTTATAFRNWVYTTKQELNKLHTAATLPSLQKGQTIPALAPSTPDPPTAQQVWLEKANRAVRMKAVIDAGVSDATLAADYAALVADLNSGSYNTSFTGGF